jgi:hypothetical protein
VSPVARQPKVRGRAATRLVLRLWAGLLALVLCGGSLGEAAHFLLVQHAICAEHGELIEVHEGSHASEPSHDTTLEHGTRASAPEEAGEHEHCQLLGLRQQELTLPEVAVATAIPQPSASHAGLLDAPTTALVSLSALSLAPKTSPPAAFG